MILGITQAVIEIVKVAIMAVKETEGLAKGRRVALRTNGPTLRPLTIDWKALDKYNELNIFKLKLRK